MRKIVTLTILFLSAFQYCGSAHASACKKQDISEENLRIHFDEDCSVDISPYESQERTRSYAFSSSGELMVFIGTQDYDTNSKATGSRTFQFLPVQTGITPYAYKDAEGKYLIITASGLVVKLAGNGELASINGSPVNLAPLEHMDIIAQKKGGIEILEIPKGIVLDYGWRKGGVAYSNLNASASVKDEQHRSCLIKNSEIFAPNPEDRSDPKAKMHTPEDWKFLLVRRCPNLQWPDSTMDIPKPTP